MGLRTGLVVGFATGYYMGAKAGHERYEQLNALLGDTRRSEAVDAAFEKAKAVIELGVERARDLTGMSLGAGADGSASR